jgi:hypothetical protein
MNREQKDQYLHVSQHSSNEMLPEWRANLKPLGRKSYGSIPHLPGSRLGPGDYCISEGQAPIMQLL